MKDNSGIVKDNFVNSTILPMHSGDATDSVPDIVTIFSSDLGMFRLTFWFIIRLQT